MKEIPDNILAQMAKQCGLNNSEFKDLVDCCLNQDKYEQLLENKGIIKPL